MFFFDSRVIHISNDDTFYLFKKNEMMEVLRFIGCATLESGRGCLISDNYIFFESLSAN